MGKGKYFPFAIAACLFISMLAMSAATFAQQENKVDPKLLDELAGGYQLEIQGQKGAFVFIVEEGKLKGAPAGEEPSELVPVEGEDLTFVGHSPDGTEHLFKFLRNEDGKVTKCVLSIPAMGLLVDMFKIER
jgi:hypothetical protein